MYDPIGTDTDLRAVQADARKRRVIERAAEHYRRLNEIEENRAHSTIALKAQIEAAKIERTYRRRVWIWAACWIAAFVACVLVLIALVLWGAW